MRTLLTELLCLAALAAAVAACVVCITTPVGSARAARYCAYAVSQGDVATARTYCTASELPPFMRAR